MQQRSERDRLVELRRDLHRRPEPAWCEFYTTARIVEELERLGVDELHVGPDAVDGDHRMAGPDDELETWYERVERDELGGSEDATYLMQHVQDRGGLAAYVALGTDHPGGHHTATFDVDEDSIPIGVEWLARTIEDVAAERP